MDATCTIQDSIHVFSLVHKYVSRILGTYQSTEFVLSPIRAFIVARMSETLTGRSILPSLLRMPWEEMNTGFSYRRISTMFRFRIRRHLTGMCSADV